MAIPAELDEPVAAAGEWGHRDFFPPGPQLAVVLCQSAESIPADAELMVAARAARRQMAWAAARQLAMLAALSERRHAEAAADPRVPSHRILDFTESLIEEIALGLGVTSNAAATLLAMADRLTRDLPAMRRLLETGQISADHVRILCDALVGLPPELIPLLEAAVAPDAPDLTTGQFRHRVKAALRALDPDRFEERLKATSKRQRRLERWDNASGTTDLALCDLPAEQAHAIYNRINAVAQAMRTDGDTRTLDQLRADLATALLHGTTLPTAAQTLHTTPAATPTAPADTIPGAHDTTPTAALGTTPGAHDTPSATAPGMPSGAASGTAAVTSPAGGSGTTEDSARVSVTTLVGASATCGGSARIGATVVCAGAMAVPAGGGQADEAGDAVPGPGVRDGDNPAVPLRAVAPGSPEPADVHLPRLLARVIDQQLDQVRRQAQAAGRLHQLPALTTRAVRRIELGLAALRGAHCQATWGDPHHHGHPGYRPPAALQRLIEERHPRCTFPSCNQSAARCDLDHTRPYDKGGTTCPCNLSPLCRRHHRLKSTPGWHLFQIWPGLLIWTTPNGTWHTVTPHARA